jgi:hypothetical protein
LAGIHGIAARSSHTQILAVAPTTADIRKARQMAARSRALAACNACKTARYRMRHDPIFHFISLPTVNSLVPICVLDIVPRCRCRAHDMLACLLRHSSPRFAARLRVKCSDLRPCPRCIKLGIACGTGDIMPIIPLVLRHTLQSRTRQRPSPCAAAS